MRAFAAVVFAVTLLAAPVHAQEGSPFASPSSYEQPKTSSSLLPRSLFDPSRLTISNSVVFGFSSGGYGYGSGSAGLVTSSLGYRMSHNTALRVDVGAHVNPAFGGQGTDKGIFLQSAAFDWRPSRNSMFRVEYRDLRSPLQGYGYAAPGYGYSPLDAWGTPYGAVLAPDAPLGGGAPGDPLRN